MAPMLPEGNAALAALDDDSFAGAMLKAMMARFRAGNRAIDMLSARGTPALEVFGNRSGGMMILASLLARAEGERVTISISDLARGFGVSRTHVLKLLGDAEAAGLLNVARHGNERRIEILPPLAEATQNLFAAVYVLMADSAREALRAIGRPLE
jgi:hypothetical protein